MLRLAAALAIFGTAAVAQSDACIQARNLSSNYWTAINTLSAILAECENDTSKTCELARAADEEIKQTGTPNGTMLLLMLPVQLCQ